MNRHWMRAVVLGLAGLSSALASPATDLYAQAAQYLQTQYYGPSTADLGALTAQYKAQLDQACASNLANCPFETAEPIIAALLEGLGDGHAYYLSPTALAEERAVQSGSALSPAPRVGVSHAGFLERNGENAQFGALNQAVLDEIAQGKAKLLSNDRLIVNVVAGSPADRAGLKPNDRWIGYDGVLFSSFADANALAAGLNEFSKRVAAGQPVTMTVVRGLDRTRLDLSVKPEIINTVSLPSLEVLPNGVAVLRIPDFLPDGAGNRVHALVREAQSKGARAIVLDVRGNGGGINVQQWLSTGAFIAAPDPVRRVARPGVGRPPSEETYRNGRVELRFAGGLPSIIPAQNPALWTGPVAVLVDGRCASACEYLSASFQRAKRGLVIGEPTAGVGNTNTARFELLNGGAAGFPTLRAVWPDGSPLPDRITPDLSVPSAAYDLFETGRDAALEKAIETLNAP